jgi:GNAT superfamily N-acetyltransferase
VSQHDTPAVGTIAVRAPRPGDGPGLAEMHLGTSAYHVEIAPDVYRLPDEEGLVDFFERGIEKGSTTQDFLALVAEVDGVVAGYLEAQLLPPLETARWQSHPDLFGPRLSINALATARPYQRRGVATRLVQAAEDWGRERGATVVICETWIDSPMSIPFWERRMGYERRAVVLRKPLT